MKTSRDDQGFALLLAILALLLLSAIGLTLALTTSAENEMTANYRAGQQALYNAEAGIEAGKRLLRDMDWDTLLPAPRYASWTASADSPPRPAPPFRGATRDFENGACDGRGGHQGYGVILNDGVTVYENRTAVFGNHLPGAFTLWIRRGLIRNQNGTFTDYAQDNDQLVLTAEGSASLPRASSAAPASRAVRLFEVTLSRSPSLPCDARSGQAGAGADGAGFEACAAVDDDSLPSELGASGTLKEIDSTQN